MRWLPVVCGRKIGGYTKQYLNRRANENQDRQHTKNGTKRHEEAFKPRDHEAIQMPRPLTDFPARDSNANRQRQAHENENERKQNE